MGDISTAPAEPSPKSFAARVLGVFWSPGETFQDIAQKPDFIAPMILLILASVAGVETMLARIGMERIVRISLEQSGQAAKLSPEQLQQAIQRGVTFGGIATHIVGVIGTPIFLLVVAGFGLLVVNAFFGSNTPFKKVFSVTCYSFMPRVLGALMTIAVILLGDPDRFNPSSPAPTNPGYFLDPQTTPRSVITLATSLDIFTIWFLILISIGLSAATGRKAKTGAIFAVFCGVWLVLVLARAGFAMITG